MLIMIVQRYTLTVVLVLAVSVFVSAGKGFNANGEQDNGKRKFKKYPILVPVHIQNSQHIDERNSIYSIDH